ncbi:MAG: heme exporter protein CcmD [Telluria sp.]
MNWSSISDFLAMGGSGAYVWGSFGVVFALMAAEVLAVGQRWRTIRQQLQRARARKKVRA